MLYFEFNYFDKFTIIKLIIKGAQNLNIIYSNFQKKIIIIPKSSFLYKKT